MKVEIVTNYDDWGGLYIDGKLKAQGHDYSHLGVIREVLEAINVFHIIYSVDDEACYFDPWGGSCPENIEDLKSWLREHGHTDI